jgi:hypothetical protein
MQDVYSKPLLTLAATGASDGNGECLFQRTIGRTRLLQLNIERRSISSRRIYRVIGDKSFTVFVRSHAQESHSQLLKADIGSSGPKPLEHQAPLTRRAWALQERLLAPRVLHFHPEEMMWQCREEYVCDCGDLQGDNTKNEINGLDPLLNLWKSPASVECMVSLWYKIVNYYAELSIPYDNDRLPALSGIASYFSTQLTGGYVVGLWRQDLVRGLLWSSGSHFVSTSRIDNIPTWCWASVKIIDPGLFRPIISN